MSREPLQTSVTQKKRLGYQPKTKIQDGIKKYVNFVQNNKKTRLKNII